MENYLDLQSTFKFNISVNFQRNQVRFNPDGFLIINGFKIKIIEKFAIFCSKKIFDVYSSEKMKNNYVKDRNIMKITIEKDEKLLKWMLTQDNLCILQSFFCMKSIIFTKNNMEFLKFISNELEIAILQNSLSIYEKFIEENVAFSSRSIKVLKDDENFQNMLKNYIFEKDPDIKKDQIQKMINLHLDDHYFYQSITLFFISYPMQVDKFISILKEMNKLNEYSNYLKKNLEIKSAFRAEKQYLLNLLQSKKEDGCQNQKGKSIINCMLHLIRNDDVNEFQKISASIPSFDYNLKFKLEQSFPENRITLFSNISEFFEGETNHHHFNYIDFAAFYGSINIFKYLLMMKVGFNRFTALFAVSGGNIEIIHLCEQNKCNFKNALKCAIIYRHVELVDWLIDTINVDNFESFIDDMIFFHQNDLILKFINLSHSEKIIQQLIIKSIVYDNYQLFLFLNDVEKIDLKFKYDKNKGNIFSLLSNCSNIKFYEYLFNLTDQKLILEARDIYGQTPAHIAAIKGNLLLLKFLVEKKVNIESLAFDDLTPLHFACMYGQYEIVKFITSLPSINVNCLDRYKQTPLAKACITNNLNTLKIVEHLLNNIFVKCNYIDVNNKTILLNAIHNGIDDVPLMLINSNKNVDINKGDMFYNPLCLACKLNKIEIVRCLIDHKELKINEQMTNGIFHTLIVQPFILQFQVQFKLLTYF